MKLIELFESTNFKIKDWEKLSTETTHELELFLGRNLNPTSGDCFIIATALFLKARKLDNVDNLIIGDNGPHAAIYDFNLDVSIDGTGVYSYDDALQGRRTRTWKTIAGFIKTAKQVSDEAQSKDIDMVLNKYR